jgi:POT family proton-dependent oligopeptide transporter
VFPVGLALYSRASPKGYAGIMIPLYYLNLTIAGFLIGILGTLLDRMPAVSFWLLHAGLIAGAAAILLVVRITLGHTLVPEYDNAPETEAEAASEIR